MTMMQKIVSCLLDYDNCVEVKADILNPLKDEEGDLLDKNNEYMEMISKSQVSLAMHVTFRCLEYSLTWRSFIGCDRSRER